MNYKNNYILLIIMFLFFSIGLKANTNHLISAQELNQLIKDDTSIIVIDVRKEAEFNLGHLLNARNLWRNDFNDTTNYEYGGMMATKEEIETILSLVGANTDSKLILYDDKSGCDAARFWWILNYYGHTNVLILNGGLTAWNSAEFNLSTEQVAYYKSDYQFLPNNNKKYFVNQAEVEHAVSTDKIILLDVRSKDEFEGKIQKDGAYAVGRIPSSINMDWVNLVNYNGDKTFKQKDELIKKLQEYGIDSTTDVIVYCQSGARSAHTTFVLTQLLGYNKVKNYDGSWIEWSYHNMPKDTGEVINISDVIIVESKSYGDIFLESFGNYGNYIWSEITFQTNPWYQNYFWLLVLLSLVVWCLEMLFPWRKDQPKIRSDFWIDAFYMFFNFYIFNLVIFIAFSNVTTQFFKDIFGGDLSNFALIDIKNYSEWVQLLIFFVATDFIQWFTHVLLHRFNFLWRFHKVHHSVEVMGFAAHLRYHWMENVFYTPMKYIMVMLLGGFAPEQAFIVYYVAIAIGHLNHANLGWNYGPLKYIFNNPKMHIWHHYYSMPDNHKHGVNFGISLSIWDYIFKTSYIPSSGRDIKLGFENIESYPKSFFRHLTIGFKKKD